MTILINDDFVQTEHNRKCYKVSAAPANKIHYKLTSKDDPWDRLFSLIINNAEILRAVTTYGGTIEQTVEIPQELSSAFSLGNEVCGILTTFVGGGWHCYAETVNETTPKYGLIPAFTWETMNSQKRVLETTIPPTSVRKIFLYATGHYLEEGGSNKTFQIYLNGNLVFERNLPWGWSPGCGYIKPYDVDVEIENVTKVRIESPNCGDYWITSLILTTPTPPPPPPKAEVMFSLLPIILGAVWLGSASEKAIT
jgi:hypothetical protein